MKMANPKLSVLMSVFNNRGYLKKAIESILSQTFADFEFLIIDDSSNDNSKETILSYKDSRIVFIENDRNMGLAKSLNKGLEISKGKYIARMDADDVSRPDRLARQIEILEANPKIGIVGSHFEIIDNRGKIFATRKVPNDNAIIRTMLANAQNPLAHGSVMFVKDYILLIGGYNEQFPYAQDFELWSRMSKKFLFYIEEKLLYQLRSHPELNKEKYALQKFYRHYVASYCKDTSFVPPPQKTDIEGVLDNNDLRFCHYYTCNYYLWIARANIFKNPFYSLGCALKSFKAAAGLRGNIFLAKRLLDFILPK